MSIKTVFLHFLNFCFIIAWKSGSISIYTRLSSTKRGITKSRRSFFNTKTSSLQPLGKKTFTPSFLFSFPKWDHLWHWSLYSKIFHWCLTSFPSSTSSHSNSDNTLCSNRISSPNPVTFPPLPYPSPLFLHLPHLPLTIPITFLSPSFPPTPSATSTTRCCSYILILCFDLSVERNRV